MSREPMIRAGTWLCCSGPKTHKVWQAIGDYYAGDIVQAENFRDTKGRHPENNTPFVKKCPKCKWPWLDDYGPLWLERPHAPENNVDNTP